MTPIGKSLVFYFKYQPEMHRLYFKKKNPDEDVDPEVFRMVQAVGNQCCQEVGAFLGECGRIIQSHFDTIAKCSVPDVNTTKWTVSCGVWSKHKGKPKNQNWRMVAGVDIPRTKPEVIAWMWSVGEGGGAELMLKHFNTTGKTSIEPDLPTGRIALVRIPIMVAELPGFELDSEPLLAQVKLAFSQINQERFDNAYNELLIKKF